MQTLPERLRQSRARLTRHARLFLVQTRDAGGDLAGETRRATEAFLGDTRQAGKAFVLSTRKAGAGLFGATREEAQRWTVFLKESRPGAAAPREPFKGYDELSAREIVRKLSTLKPSEAARVSQYEEANRARVTILKAARSRAA